MPPGEVTSRTELEQLAERVCELERRISALERPSKQQIGDIYASPMTAAKTGASPAAQAQPSIFSILGTAVLGIAGAYVLRAAAESGIFPSFIAVTLALIYAAAWFIAAAWPSRHSRLARDTYAITAALILAPLLWETTVRFQMLAPALAAVVLALFAALAIGLAWRGKFAAIAWIGTLSAVITALVLMVATRALTPFTLSLLAMALLTEFATVRVRWRELRPIAAAGADLAILIVVLILGNRATIPPAYKPIGAGAIVALAATLFGIYAAHISVRSLLFRLKVTIFEAAQLVVAVLLAGWAVLRVTNGDGRTALGVILLVAGAACYFVAFGVLGRHRELPNFYFYGACGLVFAMAGSLFAMTSLSLVTSLCFAAVLTTVLGVYFHSPALDLHGVAYLTAAMAGSGLLDYAGRALAGTFPPVPGALVFLAAAAALVCAAMIARYPGEHPGERVLRLLPALWAVYSIAALSVAGIVRVLARDTPPTHPQLAVIRTVVTCAAALLLAFVGTRWTRRELVWMAYAAAIVGSLKLLLEDLRFGTTQSLAASLLIYGAVLILIPRLVRARKRPA